LNVTSFFRDRGPWLAAVVVIMLAISIAQAGISYTMTFGALSGLLPRDHSATTTLLVGARFGLVALMAALWVAGRKRVLFRLIVIVNALFTLALLVHTSALTTVLFNGASEAVNALLVDVVLMATANILIFSVWYWIIDPPGVKDIPRADEPWEFLFPQRAGAIPHYESWVPRYGDYLYLAFTTSFTFSPSETAPLTKRAKGLMLLQAVISVVTLTAIAGSAINILAGGK
jgi:hypothetical protein